MAKNKEDGKTYAAKIRFNPATEKRTRNNKEKIVIAYKRFIREVIGMSMCDHKNIVKFKEALRDADGDLYIFMESCDLELEGKIKKDIEESRGPIEERLLVDILREIGEGIHYMHSNKLSHRDIDP